MLKYWTKRTDVDAKISPILYLSYKRGLCLYAINIPSLTPQTVSRPERAENEGSLRWVPMSQHAEKRDVNGPAKSDMDFTNCGLAAWATFPLWGSTLFNYLHLSKSGVARSLNGLRDRTFFCWLGTATYPQFLLSALFLNIPLVKQWKVENHDVAE